MKELKYLNKYLLKYKWRLVSGVFFLVLATMLNIFPAQLVRRSINLVIDNIRAYRSLNEVAARQSFYDVFTHDILIYVALILAMALLRGGVLYFVRQSLIVMSRLVEYDLKNEIFEHYQRLPLSFYVKNSTGDLMNRISEDVTRVRMYLGPSIMYGLQLTILFLMLTPMMISVSPKLTAYALAPLPVLSFVIYVVHSIIERRSERIQRSQSQLSTLVQEAFSGIRVLKSFVREEESLLHFSTESNRYMKHSLKLTYVQSFFFPIITGLIGLSSLLVVYAGGKEIMRGNLTFGHIVEFIVYVNLLTWPVISLGWVSSIVQRAEASQKRINEFLKTPIYSSVKNVNVIKAPVAGHIEFKNVSFVYPETQIKALKNVFFSVASGETLAIIGSTGSGKSTLVNLLGKLYDPTEGEVLIDGRPITQCDPENLRSYMGFVLQDVFLFSDTIYNNISFGTLAPDSERIVQVAKEVDMYEDIMSFSKGFQTYVGERGVALSGGQKQRISIARALIRRPQVLLLDDALSAVDTNTENTILTNLDLAMKGRTSIILSHRVSSAKLADRIIVMHEGSILEEGTHEYLFKVGGVYRDIYEAQMQSDHL